MKHLKKYSLFESDQVFLSETIMDICLDLEDEGFYTSVSPESEQKKHIQKLRITLCDDDYIADISSAAFTPVDIKDTLDRIYDVIGKNLLSTSIRLYNTNNSYYEVNMLKSIGHQSTKNYPETKVYGLEIRFFQPGDYGTTILTNESNLIVYESREDNDEMYEYIDTILLDIYDFGLLYDFSLYNQYRENYEAKRTDKNLPITRVQVDVCGRDKVMGIDSPFKYSDISNSINHITSYLSEMGFKIDPLSTSYKYEGAKPAELGLELTEFQYHDWRTQKADGIDGKSLVSYRITYLKK